MASTPTPCPNCGTLSPGKFCTECGSALLGVQCGACHALLTPGARFCHQCGAPAGASAPRQAAPGAPLAAAAPRRTLLPWAIAGAAALAVVIAVAVQQGGEPPRQPSVDVPLGAPAAGAGGLGGGGAVRAPDISAMSPRERADRLYDRVMRLSAEGKSDSAAFFATMAAQAYELLGPLDNDLRYDYGRMAETSGNLALAREQADAILRSAPDHLLGLILRARVAQLENDAATRKRTYDRLLAVQAAQLATNLEEYTRHRGDIDAALEEARR